MSVFIVVGEDVADNIGYYKVQQLNKEGLSLFGGLDIEFTALNIPEKEFKWDGTTYTELDIPK